MMILYSNGPVSRPTSRVTALLVAAFLSSSVIVLQIHAQSPAGSETSRAKTSHPVRYSPNPMSRRAENYYDLFWGVNSLKVKSTEANEVIRFSYRVLDPDKAQPLNEAKNEPSLVAPRAGVRLVVPSLEKVGKLRQSSSAQAGKMYWMAFSNKGRLVKPGDRVNVVIGNFRAIGLVVE